MRFQFAVSRPCLHGVAGAAGRVQQASGSVAAHVEHPDDELRIDKVHSALAAKDEETQLAERTEDNPITTAEPNSAGGALAGWPRDFPVLTRVGPLRMSLPTIPCVLREIDQPRKDVRGSGTTTAVVSWIRCDTYPNNSLPPSASSARTLRRRCLGL